jgi:purine nucleosidase
MLDFFDRYDIEKYGSEGGPLHDPCVIAYLLEPDIFSGKPCHVEIEIASEATIGMTLVDWWGVTGSEPNALVIGDLDPDRFFSLLVDRIATVAHD